MRRKARRASRRPPDIERVRQRIEQWRRTRGKKTRMPEQLWAAAVALAREHGIYGASRGLRVNYDSLKRRLKGRRWEKRAPKPASAATFIELGAPLPLAGGPAGATLELEDSTGAKLAVRLAAGDTMDLLGLAQAFWSRRA
jgi:hypothetical protein